MPVYGFLFFFVVNQISLQWSEINIVDLTQQCFLQRCFLFTCITVLHFIKPVYPLPTVYLCTLFPHRDKVNGFICYRLYFFVWGEGVIFVVVKNESLHAYQNLCDFSKFKSRYLFLCANFVRPAQNAASGGINRVLSLSSQKNLKCLGTPLVLSPPAHLRSCLFCQISSEESKQSHHITTSYWHPVSFTLFWLTYSSAGGSQSLRDLEDSALKSGISFRRRSHIPTSLKAKRSRQLMYNSTEDIHDDVISTPPLGQFCWQVTCGQLHL